MIGSTPPWDGDPGSQPRRPPSARVRSGFSSSAAIAAKRWGPSKGSPSPRIEAAMSEALREATFPRSLTAHLKALASDNDELASFLGDLASAVRPEYDIGLDVSDSEAFAAGLPLEPRASRPASQAHVQALVHAFHRRQRQASMLVAGCVATSFVLTLVGIATLASFAGRSPTDAEPVSKNSTSVAWQRPQPATPPIMLILASATPDRAGLVRARAATGNAETPLDAGATPQESNNSVPKLVLMPAGRPLALSSLLSQRQARYVLLRGLPSEAMLSAGQRNPSGAWIVKDKDLGQLTLSIEGNAGGDYPVEVYALGAGSLPQGRQRLVFRVQPARGQPAALDTNWAAPLRQMALTSAGRPEAAVTIDPSPLMARAMRLLGEGDIAAARLLFECLADLEQGDAAYGLGRTFDPQALAELGARGMGADRTALNWYEYASETRSSMATERLKILASLSD